MSDNAQAIGMSVNDAAQSFASMLDTEEAVDTGAEAQTTDEEAQEVESEDLESVEPQDEAEEDSEDVEGEEEETEEEEPVETKFVVKVDGKELEVDKEELIRGYQREADYTRKTQKLAEERRQVESEFQQVRAEREQYAQVLGQLKQKVQEFEPAEPDWNALEAQDPVEYARQWTHFQRRQQQMQAIQQEEARVNALRQVEQQKHLQELLIAERDKLIEKIPDWKNPEKAKAERDGVLEYGKQLGFSDAELDQVTDSRAVIALYKAWKYDQLMSKKPELQSKIKKAPKLLSPGSSGSVSSKSSDKARAQNRLAQTGSVKDAAALFDKFI
jgi:K+/H+ antiporter YhaU regulatory subunit KhtT